MKHGSGDVQLGATRAAIYARVSTSDGRQEVQNQIAELHRFAANQHWHIVLEFVDEEGGGSSERSSFKQMFLAASRRDFDVLLFWSLDRLSREGALETLQHLNRLTSYGVRTDHSPSPISIRWGRSRTL
jgi:DNA invertase Pin-like site-specific DNA recombinase